MPVTRPSLLLSRILSFRELSPLLILSDTIFQSAFPLLTHFEDCARSESLKVIRIGHSKKSDVCTMTAHTSTEPPRIKPLDQVITEIESLVRQFGSNKVLLTIPDLNDFLASNPAHLTTFLSSLIALNPSKISVCASYHADIPLLHYPTHLPTPETLLNYLATTIITVQSLSHVLANLSAQSRARTSEVAMDLEGKDIFVPLGSNHASLYCEVEHRRKSGRGVKESLVYHTLTHSIQSSVEIPGLAQSKEEEERDAEERRKAALQNLEEEEIGFKIGLSEKQKADRDAYELPHFQAQQRDTTKVDGIGGGGGGGDKEMNIYYEPDSGDDFDLEDPDDDLML